MKKLALLIITVFSISLSGFAQGEEYNDNFFIAAHSSLYFDYIWTPLQVELAATGNMVPDRNNPSGPLIPEYAEIPFQSFVNNIISFGVEPRYNIKTFDENSALAIAMPISLGIGQVTAPPFNDYDVGSIEGFGSLQIPLFAKLYIGSGSTYSSEKDYGVSFGLGLEFNKVGLLRLDQTAEYRGKTAFVMPVASFGFHFWRGFSPVELNIKYGEGQTQFFSFDRNGDSISDQTNGKITQGQGKGRVFRISMSQILNY